MKKAKTEKVPVLTEHQEAVNFAEWLFYAKMQGKVELYSHIPHETYTPSWNAIRKNRTEGVMPGIPDYIVITDSAVLFVELKRTKGGVVSAEQDEWNIKLAGKMTNACIAKGCSEAIAFVESYL